MQYDVKTPEEYLTRLEKDWRNDKLLQIREMILSHGKGLTETIRYKMLSYGDPSGDEYVFALNAQKHYVSLYVGDIKKNDPSGEMLSNFNQGKGCIRVRKTIVIEDTRLEEFIKEAIRLWQLEEDVNC